MRRSNIREVVLVPNRHWGGEGLLGCVFGYAYPLRSRRMISLPALGLGSSIGSRQFRKTANQARCRSSSLSPPKSWTNSNFLCQLTSRMTQRPQSRRKSGCGGSMSSGNDSRTPGVTCIRHLIHLLLPMCLGRILTSRSADVTRPGQAPTTRQNQSSLTPRTGSPVPLMTIYATQRGPARSSRSPATVPRATAPTPTSPFGYHMNGESLT